MVNRALVGNTTALPFHRRPSLSPPIRLLFRIRKSLMLNHQHDLRETQTQKPMTYTIQEIDEKTARLIIQWTPRPNVCARPIALRHCYDDQGCLDRTKGAVLGYDATLPCALLLFVRRGDLISLGEKIVGGTSASWTHYQIRPDFTLEAIANEGSILSAAKLREWMLPDVTSFHQAPGDDDALREFINDPYHPSWLLRIIERQQKKWRTNRLSKFYNLVPSEVPVAEIPQVVKLAPGAALRFFGTKLTKRQIRNCVRRDLTSAIVHAFEHLPPTQFKKALRNHPGILLTHQGNRLPANLISHCVRYDPFVAFNVRNSFKPAIHARVLAATCCLPFGLFRSGDVSQLPTEIAFSFLLYPVEWLETYHHDFSELFRVIERHGRMKTCPSLIGFLMKNLPPQHLPGLYRFVSDRI